jgi:aspartyl protease family protein
MTDSQNPWNRPPPGRRKPSNLRHFLWWALIAAGVLAIWALWRMFPGALSTAGDQGQFIKLSAMLVLIASGLVYSRRFTARETLRNIALWCGIVAALVFGYTFYHQFEDAASDIRSELVPGYPAEAGGNRMVFSENEDGDFTAIGKVNGTPVEFVIDTGASEIVLSPADARRAGIDLSALHFTGVYETANGQGHGASATLDKLEIGPVKLFDVPVSVNQTPMHASLLGMTFLRRMKSFEMKGRKLTLRWR